MLVYNLILLLCILNVFIYSKKLLFSSLLIMCSLCGLRDGVLGYDYFVYESFYNNLLVAGNEYSYEPFFYYLAYFFKYNGFPFSIFLLFSSAFFHFSLYSLLVFIKRELKINIGLVLCLYVSTTYFWHSYTLLRQSYSIAIFYLCVLLLFYNRRRFTLILINGVGLGFHIGHLSTLIVQFSQNIRFNIKNIFLFFLLFLVGVYYFPLFAKKIQQYESVTTSGIYPVVEFIFALCVFFLFIKNRNLFIVSACLGSLLAVLGFFYGEILIRFAEPLRIVVPVALSCLFNYINRLNKNIALLYVFLLILYCFFRLNYFFVNFGDYAIPYKSILDDIF